MSLKQKTVSGTPALSKLGLAAKKQTVPSQRSAEMTSKAAEKDETKKQIATGQLEAGKKDVKKKQVATGQTSKKDATSSKTNASDKKQTSQCGEDKEGAKEQQADDSKVSLVAQVATGQTSKRDATSSSKTNLSDEKQTSQCGEDRGTEEQQADASKVSLIVPLLAQDNSSKVDTCVEKESSEAEKKCEDGGTSKIVTELSKEKEEKQELSDIVGADFAKLQVGVNVFCFLMRHSWHC